MAIAANMNQDDNNCSNTCDDDNHEHDMLMPGFRFHPTEEELLEFYLRRKVEGKRFNVELITFLDLYRYDPWELPALAAIGEKEWFFYVPRDRKYRNGDRPNRVTTSGYWKATGADRMIQGENSRSIGLKKTLVFYSGKAPKGIRTSWIMNEYRLPQHETERYQKAEMSLCRVYKRPGVEDHPSLPRCNPSRASSSSSSSRAGTQFNQRKQEEAAASICKLNFGGYSQEKETNGNSTSDVTTALGLSKNIAYQTMVPNSTTVVIPAAMDEDRILLEQSRQIATATNLFAGASSSSSLPSLGVDDLQRLLSYQQQQVSASLNHQQEFHNNHDQQSFQYFTMPSHSEALSLGMLTNPYPASFQDRIWEWSQMADAAKDYNNHFK